MRRTTNGRDLVALGARGLNQVPTALLIAAEGFWIGILYSLLQIESREPATLGPLVFAVGAAAGALSGRHGPRSAGSRWPLVATLLVGLAAVIGWMLSGQTRAELLSAYPAAALSAHPGGWLMGLAFLRGVSISTADRDAAPAGSLVVVGIPAIALAYALANTMDQPRLAAFAADAHPDTILFVACGLVGLALVRIRWLGAISLVSWNTNRAWLGLLVVLVTGMLLIAVPTSLTIAPVVMLMVALLPLPLFAAGLIIGVDWRLFRTIISMIAFAVVGVAFVVVILGRTSSSEQGAVGGAPVSGTQTDQTWLIVVGWLVLVVVLAVAVAIVVLLWTRQASTRLEDAGEERTIDRGPERQRQRSSIRSRQPRRWGTPQDAVEAYLAALGLLASDDDLRRRPGETPGEHVRRLRSLEPPAATAPSIARPLALLAADFELLRFADRALTPAEHRRGLERWGAIRAIVRKRPRPRHA
jgi:hypothetical protein